MHALFLPLEFPHKPAVVPGQIQDLTAGAFIWRASVELKARRWRLALYGGEQMQEFTWSGRALETGLACDLQKGTVSREFERHIEECGMLAFRVARGVLHNSADAEDVAQEAMLRSYRRFSRLRDPSRFRAWLVRISFRLALDHTRSARRRLQRETAWATDLPKPNAEDIAASNEFGQRLREAMQGLSGKARLVLLLTSMDGHSLEEVADLLQLPVGTVKSRLHSARKQLAEKLR
jgi:RNA polymerase sigma-70 factor, ECF subfamily